MLLDWIYQDWSLYYLSATINSSLLFSLFFFYIGFQGFGCSYMSIEPSLKLLHSIWLLAKFLYLGLGLTPVMLNRIMLQAVCDLFMLANWIPTYIANCLANCLKELYSLFLIRIWEIGESWTLYLVHLRGQLIYLTWEQLGFQFGFLIT